MILNSEAFPLQIFQLRIFYPCSYTQLISSSSSSSSFSLRMKDSITLASSSFEIYLARGLYTCLLFKGESLFLFGESFLLFTGEFLFECSTFLGDLLLTLGSQLSMSSSILQIESNLLEQSQLNLMRGDDATRDLILLG